MSEWTTVGHIDVDAGLCWVGDPCYHSDGKSIFSDWSAFCNQLDIDKKGAQSFNHAAGHEGLGVVVSTGYGDGTYPVQIKKNDEGRVAEVRVVFDGEEANA